MGMQLMWPMHICVAVESRGWLVDECVGSMVGELLRRAWMTAGLLAAGSTVCAQAWGQQAVMPAVPALETELRQNNASSTNKSHS